MTVLIRDWEKTTKGLEADHERGVSVGGALTKEKHDIIAR